MGGAGSADLGREWLWFRRPEAPRDADIDAQPHHSGDERRLARMRLAQSETKGERIARIEDVEIAIRRRDALPGVDAFVALR